MTTSSLAYEALPDARSDYVQRGVRILTPEVPAKKSKSVCCGPSSFSYSCSCGEIYFAGHGCGNFDCELCQEENSRQRAGRLWKTLAMFGEVAHGRLVFTLPFPAWTIVKDSPSKKSAWNKAVIRLSDLWTAKTFDLPHSHAFGFVSMRHPTNKRGEWFPHIEVHWAFMSGIVFSLADAHYTELHSVGKAFDDWFVAPHVLRRIKVAYRKVLLSLFPNIQVPEEVDVHYQFTMPEDQGAQRHRSNYGARTFPGYRKWCGNLRYWGLLHNSKRKGLRQALREHEIFSLQNPDRICTECGLAIPKVSEWELVADPSGREKNKSHPEAWQDAHERWLRGNGYD